MQTIKIENCTEYNHFKVIVNGEKYITYQTSTICVADNKPIIIKAKYLWLSSPIYTFVTNENISLQILTHQQVKKWNWLGPIVGAFCGSIVAYLSNDWPIYALGIFLLFMAIYVIIAKKTYVIKEINVVELL